MNPASQHPLNRASQQIRYVFLDRDGVINRKPPEGKYVADWDEFEILPGVEDAIANLNRLGRHVIVLTNQRGVGLGLYTPADVESLHVALQQHLAKHGARIDGFYYCPHDKDQCDCRKPKPGLFLQAFHDFPDASPSNGVVIGDSLSDIEGARNIGMRAIFITGDPRTRKPGAEKAIALADAVAGSLAEAVALLLQ